MATLANLIVEISARTVRLAQGLTGARARIQNFAKSAVQILKRIAVGLAAGIGVAIAAIVATVNKYAAQIDKLAKTSDKLGVNVAALQKLQYQAELTGVSADTMNMAMQRMVRRVSEAAQGTGEAKNALRELGLDINKLNRMAPDKQFYAISEAMGRIGSQGDKVRLAMKIFDTEGVSLVNTMNSNLAKTSEEFDSLGISVSQSQARMVEAYQDSKTKLGAIFSGFGIQLSAQLAAPFTRLIEWITQAVKKLGGMDQAAAKFSSALINGIADVIEFSGNLFNYFRSISLWLKKIKLAAQETARNLTFTSALEAGGKLFDKDFKINIFGDVGETRKQIAELESKINNTSQISDEFRKKADELRVLIGADSGKSSVDKAIEAYDKSTGSVSKLADAADKAAQAIAPKAKTAQKASQSNVINFNDFKSRMAANRINPNVADNPFSKFRGANSPGIFRDEKPTGKLGSVQDYINASPAGKTLQDYMNNATHRPARITMKSLTSLGPDSAVDTKGIPYQGDNLNKLLNKPTTKVTLEMVTDVGKIAGDIFAEEQFVQKLRSFNDQHTNDAARQASL